MTQKEGYVSENDGEITVVLDTNLDTALVEEGFVREIISKVQTMRKEADFNVTDHIRISYTGTDTIDKIFAGYAADIQKDTLCDELEKAEPEGYVKDWDLNGEACTIGVKQI